LSTEYLAFVSVYAVLLVAGSFVVLTDGGQALIVRAMEYLGNQTGAGRWGFLRPFGYEPAMDAIPMGERAALAESYIEAAESETLVGAHVSLWVLISGCVACAFAAALIVGVFPSYVASGVWPYETYRRAAMLVVYGSAAGGLVVAVGLTAWLVRRTMSVNCTDGCAAARSLVALTQRAGVPAELAARFRSGSYPHLSRLLTDVST
jgi:hypothetical protein